MAATDVAGTIMAVLFLILGWYSVASEKTMLFNSSNDSNDIKICKDKQWQQYYAGSDGAIMFLTADVKQRILYWVTRKGFFSLDVDGNKTVVNLSKKFKKGLVFQVLLKRVVAVNRFASMEFRVHNGQMIFAETNWGLMKFDVKTNRQLFNFKVVNVKNLYHLTSIISIDYYGNEASLYWLGPRDYQISRYLINSNINQIVVQELPENWIAVNVHHEKVYWTMYYDKYFTTNLNLRNRHSWINYESISYVLARGTMYYSYHRNISSMLSKVIYPLKPYLCPCPDKFYNKLVVMPGSETPTDQTVNGDAIVDAVKTGIWSTSDFRIRGKKYEKYHRGSSLGNYVKNPPRDAPLWTYGRTHMGDANVRPIS
ncbi:hypothetical protein LOTGIDRAFT_174126 [Lottia gigantea]|uniref:Uncharacterized protein n=1 Tax=Lottia gigantea TaxID=225164 RepID=V4AN60_LOTGI|nr:hypothetical protein LOTGIDRAFT_174126 [Lottia gigantea]ESO98592.1 hypothetical protein LOTGIDRAFT_174126 [Lottia gigantea]